MANVKRLGKLLDAANLMARKQDGKVLVYNRNHKFLSRGVLVDDLEAAERLVLQYVRYVQTSGFLPLTEFAADHQYRAVPFKEVDNRVDEQSAYYINKAAMSSVSRINLLQTAKALQERVATSYSSRVVAKHVTESDVRRYLKLKQAASFELEGAEKVD
jgi:hypothetical protein